MDGAITLKNYGSASVTVPSLTLVAAAETSVTYQHSEFTLAPGASHSITFQIQGGNQIQPQQALTFALTSASPSFNYLFQMAGGGARFNVVDVTGILNIGATSTATYRVMNTGPLAFSAAEVRFNRSQALRPSPPHRSSWAVSPPARSRALMCRSPSPAEPGMAATCLCA